MAEKDKKGSCETCASKGTCGIDEEKLLQPVLSRIKHKLMVMSGKGGVGKSTVAASLAVTLAQKGYRVGLLDVDLHGPSIPHLLNLKGLLDIAPDQQKILPKKVMPNLEVVSIECLMADKDQAVIWRGPLKHSAIRQFIGDVEWDELDYLVIDSPPGTGDEPLSVAQLIPDAQAIIVTTPQEVSLADVRKSITFCRQVQMDIVGLVENMSGFVCPHCGKEVDIFKTGGGEKTAQEKDIPFLGRLPLDPRVVEAGDNGNLVEFFQNNPDSVYVKGFHKVADEVIEEVKKREIKPVSLSEIRALKEYKVAIPLKAGKPAHFLTEADELAMVHVKNGEIKKVEKLRPSEGDKVTPIAIVHLGANLVMTQCMKEKAKYIFHRNKVGILLDIPELSPEELVEKFIKSELGGE